MKLYKSSLLGILAAGLLCGCTDRFDEMNTNPGTVTEANLKYILPTVQELACHVDATGYYQLADNLYAQKYCQYFANMSTSFPTDRYGYNDSWSEAGFWTPYYLVLKHMKVAKETAAANPEQSNFCQMIRIITAWNTIGMTDCFGDIPYSTAGVGETQNLYDSQESIYRDVFKELTEAAAALQANSGQETCDANNDLIFGGDVQKWIRFANSLRLRYALRIRFVDPAWAQQEGEAALASALMESNDDNAYITCSATGSGYGWGNPLYQICGWNEFAMSEKMYDVLTGLSTVEDPRLPLWFGVTKVYGDSIAVGGSTAGLPKYQGLPNGLSVTELGTPQYSNTQYSFTWGLQAFPEYNTTGAAGNCGNIPVTNVPLKVMTYGEVCQLKAEAALAGWNGAGSAQQNYEDGIRASFADERSFLSDKSLSDTSNDETYITTGDVAWSSDPQKQLEQIITQKWLALYPSGVEAWAEVRRTGYPEMIPVKHSEDPNINPANGEFITKIRYIDSERRENAANALSPSLNQGQGDGSTVKVWWHTANGQ